MQSMVMPAAKNTKYSTRGLPLNWRVYLHYEIPDQEDREEDYQDCYDLNRSVLCHWSTVVFAPRLDRLGEATTNGDEHVDAGEVIRE